jgi:hypothetical protein
MAGHREYYKGEGGGFPKVWVVVSLMSSRMPVASLCIKNALILYINCLVYVSVV